MLLQETLNLSLSIMKYKVFVIRLFLCFAYFSQFRPVRCLLSLSLIFLAFFLICLPVLLSPLSTLLLSLCFSFIHSSCILFFEFFVHVQIISYRVVHTICSIKGCCVSIFLFVYSSEIQIYGAN